MIAFISHKKKLSLSNTNLHQVYKIKGHSFNPSLLKLAHFLSMKRVLGALTVCLQQLLLGGHGVRAVFGWQHHSQANVVLLRGGGPPHDGQQPHRVGLRSRTEALHTEPGGVAQARRRRKQALTWRTKRRNHFLICHNSFASVSSLLSYTVHVLECCANLFILMWLISINLWGHFFL